MDKGLKTLEDALREEARLLATKRRVVRILARLPDDEARGRVLGAVMVLKGFAWLW